LAGLTKTLNANNDALERILDACVGLQLLSREGEEYRNTPVATTYLCKASPDRLTDYINYSNKFLWKLWGNLEDAIREGTNRWYQTFGLEGSIFENFFKTDDARREFLLSMHGYGLVSSPDVAGAFDLSRFSRLVDLGGATGHLAIAICERFPGITATVLDLPEVCPLAREVIAASPLADRIAVIPGDFFAGELPDGDLFALARVLHDWAESKVLKLLSRIFDRLPSGGAVLIGEKMIDEDRAGPKWAQMQNLGMLLYCEGKERTLTEYKALLHRVGFAEVSGVTTPTPLDAILALKS
jgi:acetylserotonin N-methyltransferase